MKNTLRLWVGVLAIGFRFLPLSLFFWWRREKRIDYGKQKFRDTDGLDFVGQGHLWWVKEKHDLFGLVCGGVLVPSLVCVVVKIWAMMRGIWQS